MSSHDTGQGGPAPSTSRSAAGNPPDQTQISEVDADGVLAIGHLPLVRWISPSKFVLDSIHGESLLDKLGSVPNAEKQRWKGFYCYAVPFTNFAFVTNLSKEVFLELLHLFFARSDPSQVGDENQWLAHNSHDRGAVKARLARVQNAHIKVDSHFLENFGFFAVQQVSELIPSGRILGGYFWFGMRAPFEPFWANVSATLDFDDVIYGNVHLAVHVASTSPARIVSLDRPQLGEFGAKNTDWFHSLGLVNGGNATFNKGSGLCNRMQADLHTSVAKVRAYNPLLMHCRAPDLRVFRGPLAALAVLGASSSFEPNGPFRKLVSDCTRWLNSVDPTLRRLADQGSSFSFLEQPLSVQKCRGEGGTLSPLPRGEITCWGVPK